MSNFDVTIIILLALGVIASNLAVLKYSTKFTLPPQKNKIPNPPVNDDDYNNATAANDKCNSNSDAKSPN